MPEITDRDVFSEAWIPERAALKNMAAGELAAVAASIRRIIAAAVAANGGHLASNMGVVELTLALHRIYDFPPDVLLFDVGHQCYAHKILTGRKEGFRRLRRPGGVAGFPEPAEDASDPFIVGHAGTAISTAVGLAEGFRKAGRNEHVVALVGDAAIQNGMSLEALNHLAESGLDVLVVLNDNEMGISPTVGAISQSISRLRANGRYRRLKAELARFAEQVPLLGRPVERLAEMLADAAKRLLSPGAIFEILGIRYYGPVDGHDLAALASQLRALKNISGPRLLHVVTKKGYGHASAEQDPTGFHAAGGREDGQGSNVDMWTCGHVGKEEEALPSLRPSVLSLQPSALKQAVAASPPDYLAAAGSYSEAFGRILERLMGEDERVVAITAAMLTGTGLDAVKAKYPERVYDVGIAEAHAVGFAAGLAKAGCRPVVAIYSTFLQRALDQVFQEACLQQRLGIVFAIDRAGVVGSDGPTHQGVYDIAYLRLLPGMVLAAPRDATLLEAMLRQALAYDGPFAIRYPKDAPAALAPHGKVDRWTSGQVDKEKCPAFTTHPSSSILEMGKAELLRAGEDVALVALGAAVEWCLAAADLLADKGLEPAVLDLRYASPLDEALLVQTAGNVRLLATVEDGVISGGSGQAVAALLARRGLVGKCRFITLGIEDGRLPHAPRAALLHALRLTPEGIAESVAEEIGA